MLARMPQARDGRRSPCADPTLSPTVPVPPEPPFRPGNTVVVEKIRGSSPTRGAEPCCSTTPSTSPASARSSIPADGYLTELRRTAAPPPGQAEEVQFSAATQTYKAGQFVLKASGDFQNLVSLAPADVIPTGIWAQAASIAFRGALKVVCVPKGSTWS